MSSWMHDTVTARLSLQLQVEGHGAIFALDYVAQERGLPVKHLEGLVEDGTLEWVGMHWHADGRDRREPRRRRPSPARPAAARLNQAADNVTP